MTKLYAISPPATAISNCYLTVTLGNVTLGNVTLGNVTLSSLS